MDTQFGIKNHLENGAVPGNLLFLEKIHDHDCDHLGLWRFPYYDLEIVLCYHQTWKQGRKILTKTGWIAKADFLIKGRLLTNEVLVKITSWNSFINSVLSIFHILKVNFSWEHVIDSKKISKLVNCHSVAWFSKYIIRTLKMLFTLAINVSTVTTMRYLTGNGIKKTRVDPVITYG